MSKVWLVDACFSVSTAIIVHLYLATHERDRDGGTEGIVTESGKGHNSVETKETVQLKE